MKMAEKPLKVFETLDPELLKLVVGHMRLFDPGFQYAQKTIKETEGISLLN